MFAGAAAFAQEPPDVGTTTAETTTTTAPPATGSEDGSGGGSSTVPLFPVVAVVSVVGLTTAAATATILASGRGRRSTSPPVPDELDQIMDFLRRLAEVSRVADIGALAAHETCEAIEATGAALFQGPDMRVIAGSAGDVDDLGRGEAIRRAVDTARPVRTTGRAAELYVPIVAHGKVVAVLAATRSAGRPFTLAEQDRLALLSPHLGSSLTRAAEHDSTEELAFVDGLTQLANRRRLDQDLTETLSSWLARGRPVGFAMVDVDHFKRFNDEHGHLVGDDVLRTVAEVIRCNVREQDVVYRYGGEEFSILLPGASAQEARKIAERIRDAVEREARVRSPQGREVSVTVSIGLTIATSDEPEAMVAAADGALYQAKSLGRNRVVMGKPSC